MVSIDPKSNRYIVSFKRKEERPNQTDDKVELFRHAIGLADISDIFDLHHYTGHHATTPIIKSDVTITDINSYYNPYIMAKLTPEQVIRLRKDPNVLLVEQDSVDNVTAENLGYMITKHGASSAWSLPFRGTGVNVGIIDTGTDPNHVDLKANLGGNIDFTGRGGVPAEDIDEHGTHCCGIVGAVQGNNIGMAGIAPGCKVWSLKAGGPSPTTGRGVVFLVNCIEALEFGKVNNIHIYSMSFGGPNNAISRADSLKDGYDRLGLLYFGSSGNDFTNNVLTFPAASYGVNGIAAIDIRSERANFSNSGSYVDFTGAGVNIESLANGNMYRTMSGTSMSCPAVAAVAALGLSAYRTGSTCPPYTPGAQKNKIMEQAMSQTCIQPGGSPGTKNIHFGYGIPQGNLLCKVLQGITASTTQLITA